MDPTTELQSIDTSTRSTKLKQWLVYGLIFDCILLCAVSAWFFYANQPPAMFPVDQPLVIEAGMTVDEIFSKTVAAGYARSTFLLYIQLFWFSEIETANIQAGTYMFTQPKTSYLVLQKLLANDTTQNLVRLTIPEGTRATTIAAIAANTLDEFAADTFIESALDFEGQLWPDTYLIPPDYSEAELLTLLLDTYSVQTADLKDQIAAYPLSESDIVVLASILEREANSSSSKRMVSGILQNRLAIGMALQADASIEYVLDKPLNQLAPSDLDIDSPYNTYLYPGLPPTPIGNPGLDAIMAVLNPTPSNYLFYITGNDGEFYYAEDFNQHRANIARHLR